MSKGGQQPTGQTTNTSTSSPWAGQQPYILQGFNQAQNLFNQGGQQYYPGQTYAGPTGAQLQGIQNEANLGLTGTAAQNAANPALGNVLDPNWLTANPSNPTYAQAALGNMNVNTGGYYQPLASGQQTNTMGLPTIQNIAGGNLLNTGGQPTLQQAAAGQLANTQGQPTLNQFASGADLSATNPYFSQMAQNVSAQVLPQIQAQFAGGNRLDSGLATRAASEGLGSAIGNLAYQNYQQGLQQQQQAAAQLGQLGQQNLQQQLSAANTLGYLGQGNLAAQMQAGGMLSNIGQQNIANQQAAAGALTNLGFGNIGTQLSGAQGLGQNFMGAGNQQLSAIGMAPQIGNLDYQQAAALQEAGGNIQTLNQQAIQDAVNRWNYGQQQPYQNLQTYMQGIQGTYGGQGSESQPYFTNPMANALSGGLGAYGIGNWLGGKGPGSGNAAGGAANAANAAAGGGSLFSQIGNWAGSALGGTGLGDAGYAVGDFLGSLI
jgi:hypothetical protein